MGQSGGWAVLCRGGSARGWVARLQRALHSLTPPAGEAPPLFCA